MRTTVTVKHATPVSRRLSLYGHQLGTWRSYYRGFGKRMARVQREWWRTRGEGSWPALRPSTLAQKAAMGFGARPPMVATGLLRDRMTRATQFMAYRAPDVAVIKVPPEVGYGEYHESTEPRQRASDGRVILPRRAIIAPNARIRREARAQLREHTRYRRGPRA